LIFNACVAVLFKQCLSDFAVIVIKCLLNIDIYCPCDTAYARSGFLCMLRYSNTKQLTPKLKYGWQSHSTMI
jgi:hypothetical protein